MEHTYYSSHELALVWEYNLHINKHAWHLNDTLMEALFVKNMELVGKLQDTARTHLYMTGQSKRIFRYGVYFFPSISGNFLHVKNENAEEFFKGIPISKEMSKLSNLNIDVGNHREIMKELFQEKLKAARVMVDGMRSGKDRQKKWGLVPPLYLLWQALEALYISLEFSVDENEKKDARLIRRYENIMFQLADMHQTLQKIRTV